MKVMKNIGIVIIIAFLCILPSINTSDAADPAQVYQITIDDGNIPDLGLSLNKERSFIITEIEPHQVTLFYGDPDPADNAGISIYFYTNDQSTYMSEHILFYESNFVQSSRYRTISWQNQTDRYALLLEDLLGNYLTGSIEFIHGTTLIGVSARLNKNTYSDSQLEAMLSKLETKAQELLSIEAMDEIHGQITGFTKPMKHIKVSLSEGQTTNETTTDAEGNYNFTRPISKGMQYNLTVTFSYAINTTTYFSLHYQEDNASVVTFRRTITVDSTSDLTQDIALDQELPQYYDGDWAKTFASMYVHFTEALEFYMIGLEVDVSYQLPLDIYTFASEQTGTRYWYNIPGKSYITIDAEKSIHESVYRPRNREYHEFSHYIMHTLYQQWPAPAPDLPVTIEERNHDGYLNPSTSDSYIEGFAEYMAAVMLEIYEEEVGTIPMTPPDTTAMTTIGALDYMYNTQWSGMELNAVAFADNGRAEENAVAGTLWDLYDDNTDYCDKTPEEMYHTYQQRFSEIQREYEAIKASFEEDAREQGETGPNATYPPMKIWTIDDFQNYKWDDDNATLGFEKVWDVIKNFHNDFTSVYNDFITKNPGQKKAIDEVFISHAFYADTDLGDGEYTPHDIYRDENHNGKYDVGEYYVDYPTDDFHYTVGEVIGQATNYDRLWRQSVQEIPGYFIKVENTVPYYLVKVSFPDQFYLDYAVRAWNENGMINIPVPPEGYSALITVVPEGVQSNGPLNFSSEVFQRHYNTSLSQGYYVEHDFQITGPIPSHPSMPGDTTTNGGSTEKQTPGFEIILFLVACIFIVLLLKKQRK
jgi:hypothetical protein